MDRFLKERLQKAKSIPGWDIKAIKALERTNRLYAERKNLARCPLCVQFLPKIGCCEETCPWIVFTDVRCVYGSNLCLPYDSRHSGMDWADLRFYNAQQRPFVRAMKFGNLENKELEPKVDHAVKKRIAQIDLWIETIKTFGTSNG